MTAPLLGRRLISRASVFLSLSASFPIALGCRGTSVGLSQSTAQCLAKSSCQNQIRPSSSRTDDMARTFTADPKGQHTATLIFLHGLGDTGQGWCDNLRSMNLDHLRIVCPTASTVPVTLNGGFPMPSWFDIFGLGMDVKEDEAGIKAASDNLKLLIDEEVKRGIPVERIVVGGFSQGGAVALHATLTGDKAVAGVAAFSTWLPLHKTLPAQVTDVGRSIPILQCHGDSDQMLPIMVGRMTAAFLSSNSKSHEMKVIPGMAHSSSLEEMQHFSSWLKKHIGQSSTL